MATTMHPRLELAVQRPTDRPHRRRIASAALHSTAPARLPLSTGQEAALEELFCEALGGQDAADVRAGKRDTHLVPLRVAARALVKGCDPRKVLAFYQGIMAQVTLVCADAMRERPCSVLDASLDETDANHALEREQVRLGSSPSEQQLLTVIRGATRQAAASLTLAERCQRELAHVQRREAAKR